MFGILLSSTVADIKIHSFLAYVKTEYYILFALGFFVSEFIIKIFRRKVNERKDGISLI